MNSRLSFSRHRLLMQWINGLACLAVTTLLLSKQIQAVALVLLAVTAMAVLLSYGFSHYQRKTLDNLLVREQKYLIGVFLLFVGISIFFYFYHSEAASFLDKPLKLILFAMVLVLLLFYPLSLYHLLMSCCFAAIIAGGVAFYQIHYLSMERAFYHTMSIQGGGIAMSLGLFSLVIAHYAKQVHKPILFVIAACGGGLGMMASFLSGSRGAWICLPLLVIILLVVYWRKITRQYLYVGVLAMGLIAMFFSLNPNVSGRLVQAADDIGLYQENKKTTSLGHRFELWKSATYAWQDKPLLGWGQENIKAVRQQQGKEKKVLGNLYKTDFHAHNQFLEELSVRGLVGFVAFLALLLVPFVIFARYRHHDNPDTRLMSHLGMLHLFLIATYCLTQAFFAHNSGMMFYALMVILFYSALYRSTQDNETTKTQNH